jgi:dienelactone hydrolase
MIAWIAPFVLTLVPLADDPPGVLPVTQPLTMEGDIATRLVAGVDRFLLRKTEESTGRRDRFWKRDLTSAQAYGESIAANRASLAHILGVRDPRVAGDGFELLSTTTHDAKVGEGTGFDVLLVRWPAIDGVHGEGLLLVPSKRERPGKTPLVIALPDADVTPEQLAGLVPGVPRTAQYARILTESGCRVLVPALIDRTVEARNGRARLSNREYLYRPSFEMGRHVLGYELQEVLAAVDLFEAEKKRTPEQASKIGVIGWGEGGWLALLAGALDSRIDAVGVSGAFGDVHHTWRQPIERNVFGLLDLFGDAELAAMVAPRALIIDEAKSPDVTIPPGTGAGPGRLATPEPDVVRAEITRARRMVQDLAPEFLTFAAGNGRVPGDPWNATSLGAFARAVGVILAPSEGGGVAKVGMPPDPADRMKRIIAEIGRHTQRLLLESPYTRQEYFKKLDTSSPEKFRETVEPYRRAFRDEVIGRFHDTVLPPSPRSRKVFDTPKLVGYEVVLDVWPDVIAYGILLLPKDLKDGEKRPVIVCQHGLEGRPSDVADPKVNNPAYNQYAVKLAERGFVTFSPQNLYIGHDAFRTLQRKANPLGKTLFSIIVPQHQAIVDWLKTQPFADPERIAFYGLSYGGKTAMRVPPLVDGYCLSICSADFNDWVWKNASTRSPYSYVWTNEYEIFEFDLGSTFNYAEMAALIAPRPFMVERGHLDGVAPDETVAYEFAKVRMLYEAKLKLPSSTCQIEFFNGPHTIHGVGTFDFLHEHLRWPRP